MTSTPGEARTAIVVGAGLGGLACATALARRGWAVVVLEREPRPEVGAGISLWPNALRALDALGLGDGVRSLALRETEAGIRDVAGRWLARTDTEALRRRYGDVVVLHRADLRRLLRDAAVAAARVHEDVEVTSAGPGGGGGGAQVVHAAGSARADLVVGADGIASAVRRSGWPAAGEPRYAGYTAWRFVARPAAPVRGGGESWGAGRRFGIAPLPDGAVYCFATANRPAHERSPDGELAQLRRRFGGWHDPIPALLDAADERAVLRNDIVEGPPLRSYVSGRLALLGDAAHAMTPNLGQGACQALEDAVSLAAHLDAAGGIDAGLAAYDADRRPRTRMVARRSRRIGAVAQWQSPVAVAVRTAAMRLTPSGATVRSLRPVLDWAPPGAG